MTYMLYVYDEYSKLGVFRIELYFGLYFLPFSEADMWQKVAGIFTSGGKHQIWYIRVLRYAESKTNREASSEISETLSFWGLFMTYITSYQIILLGVCLACLSHFMIILAKWCMKWCHCTHKDISVCAFIHISHHCYTRSFCLLQRVLMDWSIMSPVQTPGYWSFVQTVIDIQPCGWGKQTFVCFCNWQIWNIPPQKQPSPSV